MRVLSLVIPASLLLLTGCAGFSVHYDYDLQTDFRAFKTYDWTSGKKAKGKEESRGNDIIERRVTHHVDQVLAAKGFKLKKQGEPDFLIAFTPQHRTRTVHSAFTFGTGFRSGPFRFGSATRQGLTQRIPEGSILLEVFDTRSRQVVWVSVAEGALSGTDHPEDAEAKTAAAIREMLEGFPPRSR